VNGGWPKIPIRHADPVETGGRLPPKAPLCPFSIQALRKLMQKIHRLTDN
jgi:hypothetical protein